MDKVKEIIVKKPAIFLILSAVYLLSVIILKWRLHPDGDTIWFVIGGSLGVYFLDTAEVFFSLHPSPFRSILFLALFTIVSFFVVTSSGSALAIGLVLSLYVQMILWQLGEWRVVGNLNTLFATVSAPVPRVTQRAVSLLFIVLFIFETYFYLH